METPTPPTQPEAKKLPSYADHIPREYSVWNMGIYDMGAIDTIRKAMHEYYFQSMFDKSYLSLSFEALYQVYLIFRPITGKRRRLKLDEHLNNFGKRLTHFMQTSGNASSVINQQKEYMELRREMLELIKLLYRMKQEVGLGFMIEKRKEAELILEESML